MYVVIEGIAGTIPEAAPANNRVLVDPVANNCTVAPLLQDKRKFTSNEVGLLFDPDDKNVIEELDWVILLTLG